MILEGSDMLTNPFQATRLLLVVQLIVSIYLTIDYTTNAPAPHTATALVYAARDIVRYKTIAFWIYWALYPISVLFVFAMDWRRDTYPHSIEDGVRIELRNRSLMRGFEPRPLLGGNEANGGQ